MYMWLSICPSVRPVILPSICPSMSESASLSVRWVVRPSICLPFCPSFHPSVCLSVLCVQTPPFLFLANLNKLCTDYTPIWSKYTDKVLRFMVRWKKMLKVVKHSHINCYFNEENYWSSITRNHLSTMLDASGFLGWDLCPKRVLHMQTCAGRIFFWNGD